MRTTKAQNRMNKMAPSEFVLKIVFLWSYVRTLILVRRFRTRAALEAWQEKKVRSHVKWTRKNSKFYADLWKNVPDERWREFPLIEKKSMMENFSRLNTVGIDRDEAFALALRAEQTRDFSAVLNGVTVGLSSGTSGSRGLFLVNTKEQQGWAGTMLAKILPQPLWKKTRIAFFLRANSNLYQSVNKGPVRLEYFDMLKPLESLFPSLQALNPTLMISPPQVLRRLAEAMLEGRLHIQPLKIVSAAETLDPLDEALISKAFGLPVHQGYQATEGFLAATCGLGTLHLNEDLVHVEREPLDADSRRFVPIITDFRRRTQPVVRYRLNDILTEAASPCACGSPFLALERIEGRCDDVFKLPTRGTQNEMRVVFPDFIRRAVIAAHTGTAAYMVVQAASGDVTVFVEVHKGVDPKAVEDAIGNELEALWKTLNVEAPAVSYQRALPPLEGRKLRRVVSHFKQ